MQIIAHFGIKTVT